MSPSVAIAIGITAMVFGAVGFFLSMKYLSGIYADKAFQTALSEFCTYCVGLVMGSRQRMLARNKEKFDKEMSTVLQKQVNSCRISGACVPGELVSQIFEALREQIASGENIEKRKLTRIILKSLNRADTAIFFRNTCMAVFLGGALIIIGVTYL